MIIDRMVGKRRVPPGDEAETVPMFTPPPRAQTAPRATDQEAAGDRTRRTIGGAAPCPHAGRWPRSVWAKTSREP
jgi:hypothetical protein